MPPSPHAKHCDLYSPASCHHVTVQKVQGWKLRLGKGNALLRDTTGFKAHHSNSEPRSFSATTLAEDFHGEHIPTFGDHEAGRSQSQSQPLPDRGTRGSLALFSHGASQEPCCFCFPLTVPLSSACVPSPSVDSHRFVFHAGEPEREEVFPRSHSKNA